jgi:predicted Zn-dependent protease
MSDLDHLEGDLEDALKKLDRRTTFVEVLAQRSKGEAVHMDRSTLTLRREPRLQGAVVRAWGGERWVEAATSALDRRSIAAAVEAVGAGLSPRAANVTPPGASNSKRGRWTDLPAHPLRDVGSEALTELARDALGWATAAPGIKDCRIRIEWVDEERLYLNSAGARCSQVLPYVGTLVTPLAAENGKVEYDYLLQGALGGREHLALLTEENVAKTAQHSIELLHAKTSPAGETNVILDQGTTGTFAHESFGHGTEADQFVRDRSYLRPLLGQMVGPEFLTIVDDGSLPSGWGSIHFDDEGHPGQRNVLVDHGKFVGAIHDRETAAALHARPTGNARRSDFLSRLFVRMTNTIVEPGDWSLDELVEEAKEGVLLEHFTSGIEDPLGGQMQLKVKKGRRIEHGRLTDVVSSTALSGKVLDFMKSVRGMSRKSDFELSPGSCGKGHSDILPVGSGGTYLLSTAVVGPG